MKNKIKMAWLRADRYESKDGMALAREQGGQWVLRDAAGVLLTSGQYRNDIAEEFNLELSRDLMGYMLTNCPACRHFRVVQG